MIPAGEVLRRATAALAHAGIDSAALEARWLLAHALGRERSIAIDRRQEIDPAWFELLLARRVAHEPLAFIVGRQGFWTLDLEVSPVTLIPRADSETLITAAIAVRPERDVARVLDLGTGTGCLLLAALVEFPAAVGVGVDLSPAAAALAARNAQASGLANRSIFLAGNWAQALNARFDLVLSNPPYIPHDDIAVLMPEVARHEPARALDGGADGLDAYRTIFVGLETLLTSDGVAVVELGAGKMDETAALARNHGLEIMDVRPDLGGIARAMVLGLQK